MCTEQKAEIERLTEQRDVFKRLFESVNTSHFSTDSIIETMNSFYREQAEHLAGLKIEQAVKETAKEYHDAVKELFSKWDCCGCVEDRSSEEWYEDNDKIAREQFCVEVE